MALVSDVRRVLTENAQGSSWRLRIRKAPLSNPPQRIGNSLELESLVL